MASPQILGQSKTRLNLIGQRFGKLEVLEVGPLDSHKCYTWKCQCDCGNIKYIRGSSLKSGNTKSCGLCSHDSFGIEKIKLLLKENNINFIQEKIFDDLFYEETNKPVKFDLFVNDTYIIEFDGRQHFSYDKSGWNTKEIFEKTKKRDKIRNEYCYKNNIPIIRIPYNIIDDLKIDDLIVEKSSYLI